MTNRTEIIIATGFIIILTIEAIEQFLSYQTWHATEYGYLLFFFCLIGVYVWYMSQKIKEIKDE